MPAMVKARLTDPDQILAEQKAAIQRIWHLAIEHAEKNGIATMDAVNLLLLAKAKGQHEHPADVQRTLRWDKEELVMWVIYEQQWPERGSKPIESVLLFSAICCGELVKITRGNAESWLETYPDFLPEVPQLIELRRLHAEAAAAMLSDQEIRETLLAEGFHADLE